jgi:predicted TIM-barrel enzyme
MPKDTFTAAYGAKPIFAGVYTTASIDTMCAELELFLQNGMHVYVESVRSRNDASFLEADFRTIDAVLERTAGNVKGLPKIGINFLFHPDKSQQLANMYGLSFIANDTAVGTYEHKDGFADRSHTVPSNNLPRSARTHVFAGMTPGYMVNKTPPDQWDNNLLQLHENADAILVGDSLTHSALDQLSSYRKDARITKPLIAAQGVNAANITEMLRYADGAIIGSGFRNHGELSVQKIEEIKRLQIQAITS